MKHGAKVERKRCRIDDCTNKARKGGVCWTHGAKVEYKRCSVDNCNNHVVKGGVCVRHGAKVKRCSIPGCTDYVQNAGEVCSTHSEQGCTLERCNTLAIYGGYCCFHRTRPTAPLVRKAEVGKLQATKDEIQAQIQIATENEVVLRSKVEEMTKELKEVTTKFEAAESELNLTKSRLRAKSDAVTELSELNASLRNQLEKQSKGGIEVKEEELTDDEDFTARLKQRRTDEVAVNQR